MRAFKLLIAIVLLPAHTQAAEGCKEKLSWKCGDVCIHRRAKCSCDGTTFSDDEGKWCCQSALCSGGGEWNEAREYWRGKEEGEDGIIIGATCPGTVLNLTEACRGQCNFYPEDEYRMIGAVRSHIPCTPTDPSFNTTHCFIETAKEDGVYDCDNRADENPFKNVSNKNSSSILDFSKILIPCHDTSGINQGFQCSGWHDNNCLPLSYWCQTSLHSFICPELNVTSTQLSTDTQLCSDQIFWEGQNCSYAYNYRCTGATPGQCWWEGVDVCTDGSHLIGDGQRRLQCMGKAGNWKKLELCLENALKHCRGDIVCEGGENKISCKCTVPKLIHAGEVDLRDGCNEYYIEPSESGDCEGLLKCEGRAGPFKGVEVCIEEQFLCDGILQCQGGEDEFGCYGPQKTCATATGPDLNADCIFPFIWLGFLHYGCTNIDEPTPWCSTHIDADGNHVLGNWGYCNSSCDAVLQCVGENGENKCSGRAPEVCEDWSEVHKCNEYYKQGSRAEDSSGFSTCATQRALKCQTVVGGECGMDLKCVALGGRWEGLEVCIEDQYRCDGIVQCECEEDEIGCPEEATKKCTQYLCDQYYKQPKGKSCGDNLKCVARDGKYEGFEICIPSDYICDNTLQCAGGEDEEKCEPDYIEKNIFTIDQAVVCTSLGLNITRLGNVTGQFFPYRGVQCDGIRQCPEGEDEMDCNLGLVTSFFIPATTVLLIITGLTSSVWLKEIFGRGLEIKFNSEAAVEADEKNRVSVVLTGYPEEDKELIEDDFFKEVVMHVQELSLVERRRENAKLASSLRILQISLTGAFIWMKANLHPSTCRPILEDHYYTASCMERSKDWIVDRIEEAKAKYDNVNCYCRPGPRESSFDIWSLVKRIKLITIIYTDLLKDSIILAPILNIIGMDFFSKFSTFSSCLTWILILSMLLPLGFSALHTSLGDPTIILGSGSWNRYRVSPPGPKKMLALRIFTFFFYLTVPAILVNAREEAKSKRERLLESGKRHLKLHNWLARDHLKKVREVNDYLEGSRKAILTFKRNELSLETVVQIILQVIMILLQPTKTRHSATHSGLQKVFEKDHSGVSDIISQFGIVLDVQEESVATGLLIVSILWSFKTIAVTYIKVKTEEKKELFPLPNKIFLGVRCLLVYSVRISCIVSFFVPFLGLLDILAHWKADNIDMNKPSHYTNFTIVKLSTAFKLFLCLLFVQTTVMFILKLAISEKFSQAKLSIMLQHVALTVNLPDNFADWDDGVGGLVDHRQRWSRVLLENATMILVHGFSNLLLLLPIWVTAKNVMTRHAVHLGAGQVFPEEEEAAKLLLNLSQQMPIIVVASSVLDLFLVFLFQKFLHPWRRILAAADTKSESEAMMKLEESAATMRRISFATISQGEEFDATGLENPTNCSSRETVNTDCGL